MTYKDQLKAETDLVTLISQYTKLKRQGNSWVGRCPHPDHEDVHPSFYIYPNEKGVMVWYCQGCCTSHSNWGDSNFYGNDCYGFLRWMSDYKGSPHVLSFLEAISQVREFNLTHKPKPAMIQQKTRTVKDVTMPKEELYLREQRLAVAGHTNLLPQIRDILYNRGLDDKDIEEWLIGFRDIYGHYMISFPLFDKEKRVLGHISRAINDHCQKYMNSRTSEIFQKSNYLYGIHRVESQDEITVVEGVFDVILGYKYGMKNLVGCLNSNPNPDILRSWKKITLILDNDKSGQDGTKRTIEKLRDNHEIWVCNFPEKDLGELAPKIKDGLCDFVRNNTYRVC